jgi:hypothetical protein
MKAKNTLAVLFCMFWAVNVFAQTMTDIVHLKNGSLIRGIIIEQVPNETLKIQTRDGSIFVFAMSEIVKLTREIDAEVPTARNQSKTSGRDFHRHGFVNHTSVGFSLGLGNYSVEVDYAGFSDRSSAVNEDIYVRLETVNGMWLGNGLVSAGVGVGAEYFTDSEIIQLPLFVDVRILPISGSVSPSFIIQGGYSLGLVGVEVSGEPVLFSGLQAASGLGLHAALSGGSAFNMSILYDWRQFNAQYRFFGGTVNEQSTGGFLRLNLGMTF